MGKFLYLWREEGAWPFISFELAFWALGSHDLSVQQDIYICLYDTTVQFQQFLGFNKAKDHYKIKTFVDSNGASCFALSFQFVFTPNTRRISDVIRS